MSSGGKRRLDRLEAALVPMEAMAVWLQDVREHHRSVPDFARSLHGKPDEAFPLFTLTRQAETAARARAAKQRSGATDWDAVSRTEWDAVRDVAMLFYLFMETNGQLHQEKRALCLLIALLLSSIRHWFGDDPIPQWNESRERLQSAVEELYGWQLSVDRLGERYFQGICPLLAEAEQLLAWLVTQGEWLVEMFNDHLDFEVYRQQERPQQRRRKKKALLPETLDLARAEACEMMGEHKQALAFMERHLSKAV